MGAIIMELYSSWKWVVLIELQWVAPYIQWVATCLLTLIVYKYNELQMVIVTQKLSCKASHKRPFFFIMCISYPTTFPSLKVLWSQVPSQVQIQL